MDISKLLSRPKFYIDLLSTINALLIILIGILVIIGWHFNISLLTSINEEFVSMKVNTAICFLISGIILILLHHPFSIHKVIARILAATITMIGTTTLLQYIFGFNIGIDELIYHDYTIAVGTSHPGRMAPNTAFNFVLIGLAFYLFTFEKFNIKSIIVFLIVTPITISSLSIAGYVFELTELTGLVSYTQMALHTSVTFILVCSGLFISTFNQREAYSTTENKLLAGLTFATFLIITVSILSIEGIQSLLTDSEHVENTSIINNIFISVHTNIIEVQSAERGFLLAGEDKYLTTHKKSNDVIPELFKQLNLFENENSLFEKKIVQLKNIVQERLNYSYQVISLVKTKGLREARILFASGKGKNLTDSIRVFIYSLVTENNDLLKKRKIIEVSQANRIKKIILLSTLFQILLLSVILFIVIKDITGRKKAEGLLHKLNEELETANKELESFSYSVSHDLRAPLRHIDGFIKMLQSSTKEKLDDKSNRYLGIISGAAKQMGQLIDDLLHFSRMSRTAINYSLVDMNQVVNEVKEEIMSTLKNSNIEWKISNLPGIQTDPSMMRVVWMNLISNAVKYTSKVEKPIITIDAQRNENEITFIVKDNGAGFDSNYAHKLFGVFQRLHSSEEYEGTGIGLATVKRIVSRQSGRTWAEGDIGKGAAFYFSLPTKIN